MEADEIETYRAMTPGERIVLSLELAEFGWQNLDVPDLEAGRRKWAAWVAEHEKSRDAMVAKIIQELQGSSKSP